MRKRLLLLVGILAAAVVAMVAFLWLITPQHRINDESFWKIESGLTLQEVEEILGVPPGVYCSHISTGYMLSWRGFDSGETLIKRWGGKEWVADEMSIYVLFDENGRVVQAHRGYVEHEEMYLSKLRRWMHLD